MQELITGSIMNFILSTEGCLGPLTFLRIWHDNSGNGKSKGWFLDQIQITDLQTGEKYDNIIIFDDLLSEADFAVTLNAVSDVPNILM